MDFWVSLAMQIPLVAAFMWFALEMLKRFDAALERRDNALAEVVEKLENMHAELRVHDERLGHLMRTLPVREIEREHK